MDLHTSHDCVALAFPVFTKTLAASTADAHTHRHVHQTTAWTTQSPLGVALCLGRQGQGLEVSGWARTRIMYLMSLMLMKPLVCADRFVLSIPHSTNQVCLTISHSYQKPEAEVHKSTKYVNNAIASQIVIAVAVGMALTLV